MAVSPHRGTSESQLQNIRNVKVFDALDEEAINAWMDRGDVFVYGIAGVGDRLVVLYRPCNPDVKRMQALR